MDVSQLIPLECECHLPGKAEHVETDRGVGELCGGVAFSGAEPRAEESVGRAACAKALGWDEGQRCEVWAGRRLTWGQGQVWG